MFRTTVPTAALALSAAVLSAPSAVAESFNWTGTTDPQTMDPHAVNGAEQPARDAENFATRNANGTGPFVRTARDPGITTRLVPNADWSNTMIPFITIIGLQFGGVIALSIGTDDQGRGCR